MVLLLLQSVSLKASSHSDPRRRSPMQGAPQSHFNAEPTYNNHIICSQQKYQGRRILHLSDEVIKWLVHYQYRRNLVRVEVLSFLFYSSIPSRNIPDCFLLEPKLFCDTLHSKWS